MTAPDVTDSDEFSSKAALMRAFRTRRAFASLGAAYEASEDIPSNPNLGATFAGVAARRYGRRAVLQGALSVRSEEHTSELQSLMRISYAVFCLKKKTNQQ